jgi:hypothetical protein
MPNAGQVSQPPVSRCHIEAYIDAFFDRVEKTPTMLPASSENCRSPS